MVVMLHRERRRRERLASLTALAPILGASLKVGDVLERLGEAVVVRKSGKRFTSDLVLVSAGRHGPRTVSASRTQVSPPMRAVGSG
jgi:hypothetical protein